MTEFVANPGTVLLIPHQAIKYNERLDDASECSSVYSDLPSLAIDEDPKQQPQMTDDELTQRLLQFGLDRNGLPFRQDLFFKTFNDAAEFTYANEDLGFFKKMMGFDGRNCLVPHMVLWDYFGGNSCLDLNVSAGDEVAVIAEEFQVREVENIFQPSKKYFRLPRKWSLVRWTTHKQFQSKIGLIPSCWLIQKSFFDNNRRFFRNSTWFIGISDLSTAYECILEDRSSYRPGLFIIFSPIWINLEPDDYRPYILFVMCRKTDKLVEEMAKTILKEKPNGTSMERIYQQILDKKSRYLSGPGKTEVEESKKESKREGAGKDEAKNAVASAEVAENVEETGATAAGPSEDFLAEHAVCPYYLKSYTIRRSSMGRYLLFGSQYETLYDLVVHLANAPSPLPHPLDGGPTQPLGLYFDAVPPPCKTLKRDLYALPMRSEQIAAKHFDQVEEPGILAQAFSFVYRSILDPFKPSHAQYASDSGLDQGALDEAKKFMEKYDRPCTQLPIVKGLGLESAELAVPEKKEEPKDKGKLPIDACPPDESVMKALPTTMLDIRSLQYDEGDMLGSGAFGEVYRGKLMMGNSTNDVAIKRLRLVSPEKDTRQAWVSEMEVLQLVCHPNIAQFHGFCYDDSKEFVLLAFELMGIGALSEYLKSREYQITPNEQVDFMIQIARGVGHLHSFDPPIVHGDLAARNVLMTHHPTDQTRFLLKVTDFGLSKTVRHDCHTYPDDPDKIPFKWLPPEVLHRRELNIKSDIWSYGITTTEIYGIVDPYGLLGADKVLPLCNDGHRMEKPGSMPYYIYNIVLKCWRFQPQDRPCLEQVVEWLEPFYIEFESGFIESISGRLAELEKEEIENLKA